LIFRKLWRRSVIQRGNGCAIFQSSFFYWRIFFNLAKKVAAPSNRVSLFATVAAEQFRLGDVGAARQAFAATLKESLLIEKRDVKCREKHEG